MGPLAGIRIIEIAGIGPGPMCGMLLADLGAEVICVERPGGAEIGLPLAREHDFVARGRRSIALDLKQPEAIEVVLRLVENADGLIEGFRPGVMERLGLGPEACHKRNPRLVYGRITGFGQSGPLAKSAGHDINYIALGGALSAIGRKGEKPVPPLNLVGDYARRRALSRPRHARRYFARPRDGARRCGRRGHGRWRGLADGDELLAARRWDRLRRARRQTSSTPARPGTTLMRPRMGFSSRSAPSSRSFSPCWRKGSASPRRTRDGNMTAPRGPPCAKT